MRKKSLTFKPLDNYHIHWLVLGLFIFVPFDLTLIALNFEIKLLITVLVMNATAVTAFASARIIYRAKYVIDDAYVTKYVGKQTVFKIRNCNVEKIFVKKGKWHSWFRFGLMAIFNAPPDEVHMTSISIVFKNCEIIKNDKREIVGDSLKPDDYNDYFEYTEVISLRKCIKICKKLGIEPTFV